MSTRLRLLSCLVVACLLPLASRAAGLELQPGDHISIIGNTLADRMQHDGWLETTLQSRLPQHQFVVRNLGFSGDELNLRLRSAGFGSPDEWLSRNKTDVILAFFGYGESFADQAGLESFKRDLTNFIEHTRNQQYNGRSAPRLVIFSPIAHENLHDRNLPDGSENNVRLESYTAAMREVCQGANVPFVDLFTPTKARYESSTSPLTINGIHLNEHGNRVLAEIIVDALVGNAESSQVDEAALERLRAAVRDKNFHWYQRYRTVDGYSIYGGRADLQFVDGQTNRVVMQREMEVLDTMTANRDRRIWAVAQGADHTVDDSNTPPFIPVVTNKPGNLPGGKHEFLDGDEAIGHMTVAENMQVNLFASEKDFPELVNPVQMAWDPAGRLWVAVWPTYPHWKPQSPMNDKLLVLEDTNGDGRADKCTTFCDDLHCPTGFELYDGGVLIAQAPALLFLKDTDGDGRADLRVRLVDGLDTADTHHTANSFVFDAGGGVYFQEGTFHHTQVESPYGPNVRCVNAGVFRYEPRTQKFEVYITHGFANPHGHAFDAWGQDIVVDGTGAVPYHAALFSGRLDYPAKHATPPPVYRQRTRPCPGIEVLSSRHFPDEHQGNLLVPNVIGFQGILQYKLQAEGSSLSGTEVEPILSSTDPNFRPSDVKMGPDGAIYFIDWHNPIIGHMQHNLRDPSRDVEHGRIYRVTYRGRPLLTPVAIAGEPIARLLDLLREPEDRTRYRARIELAGRPTDEVIRAAQTWLASLDPHEDGFEHHRLEGLWLFQNHNVVDTELLSQVLASSDFRARAAATRVLSYWRDRVPDTLERLKELAADPHPRVRLEAVRAASFFRVPEAAEIVFIAADHPTDRYLKFTRDETMKALTPYLQQAIAQNRPIRFTTPAGMRHFVRSVSNDDLLKIERTPDVARELLARPGIRDEQRSEAASQLARLEAKSEVAVLLDALQTSDAQEKITDESVLFDLIRLTTARPAAELSSVRSNLETLAQNGRHATTRQLAIAAGIAADESVETSWRWAMDSPSRLLDLIVAMPLIRDPAARAALYPRVQAILADPASITTDKAGQTSLRHAALTALASVRGQEKAAVAAIVPHLRRNADRATAVAALLRVPTQYWPPEEARPVVDILLQYLSGLRTEARTSSDALNALQLAESATTLLSADEAGPLRKQLGELGVRVIRLGTVTDQMRYDQDRLVVQAGRPVEIIFENTDIMPHNLVVAEPGSLEEIGNQAELAATQPGAAERGFVPESGKILLASRLLAPRESQRLTFTAPTQPGVYPYVCTYPGHWRRMYGSLYVVDDLEQYQSDPEGYVARSQLAPQDALLKLNRPRREWRLDELSDSLAELEQRSYSNGKFLFQVASCVACHQLQGAGQPLGPDLAKLDAKLTPAEIVKSILEPSEKIEEKYASYVFELDSGQVVTGMILDETADEVKVIENPLAQSEPRVIPKKEIAQRAKSDSSIMPKGLLDQLTRDEILDLVAYVVARGQAPQAGAHAHHGH